MRKIIFSLFAIVCVSTNMYAQASGEAFYSAPSAASIPSYVNSPVSIATGVPDVSIPLFSLPTHSRHVAANLGLSYHPNNAGIGSKASEVGLGWTLHGNGGVIYREVNSFSGHPIDTYYYNFFGRNGKFTFSKAGAGVYNLVKLTSDRLRIQFSESGDDFKFTIIDENAVSYIFDTRDKAYWKASGTEVNFIGAYYLTRVVNASQSEIMSFGYTEDSYSVPGMYSGIKPVKSLRVNNIISHDCGSISLQYTVDPALRNKDSDQFELTSIELKSPAGKTVQKFAFQSEQVGFNFPLGYFQAPPDPCGHQISQNKRMFKKLYKYGQDNSSQITEFYYEQPEYSSNWTEPYILCFEEEYKNPKYLNKGLLTKIKFPTGAHIVYEFEPNQYFIDKNTPYYLANHAPQGNLTDREAQYYEHIGEYPFSFTNEGTILGMFNLPSNPDTADGESYIVYKLFVQSYYNNPILESGQQGFVNLTISPGPNGKFMPGHNVFVINGSGGSGVVEIKRIRYRSLPLVNYSTGNGVRIKKIEHYDNNVLVPSKSRYYYYQDFNKIQESSGILNDFANSTWVVYRNVKEVIGNNAGYTKYYFKGINDYPENVNTNSLFVTANNLNYGNLKYVNILGKGLHYKTEVYDNSNIKVAEENVTHEFYETESATYNNGVGIGTYGRNAIIKKQITSSTNILSNGSKTDINEIQRDTKDLNIIYKKSTTADGTVTEQFTTYPWGLSLTDPRLWNANVSEVPLINETKRNGTIISKTETKFEDTFHFYPTSQVSYLPDNPSQQVKNVSYDIYDDKGNLVQFTTFPDIGTGKPTTIIWGYYKTMPIAKIEGAKLSDIPTSLITAIVNASNEDADATAQTEAAKEQLLIDALNNFRTNGALQNFMVTCYTYNPLIGVTNMIPATGIMEIYQYDTYNRLQKIKDVNGTVLKEYQYNYKN